MGIRGSKYKIILNSNMSSHFTLNLNLQRQDTPKTTCINPFFRQKEEERRRRRGRKRKMERKKKKRGNIQ